MIENQMLYEIPNNNHGCRGFYVWIEPKNESEGIVMDVEQCNHPIHGNIIVDIGDIVRLPHGMTWQEATKEDNTLIQTDTSTVGRSMVVPDGLIIVE